MPETLMASTGITGEDGSVRLDIRGQCGFAVHISELGWKKLQAEEELAGFVSLISQQYTSTTFEEDSSEKEDTAEKVESVITKTNDVKMQNISRSDLKRSKIIELNISNMPDTVISTNTTDVEFKPTETYESETPISKSDVTSDMELGAPLEVFDKAMFAMRQAEVSKSIDSASFVYFTDTGGQPEFQELFPLLNAPSNIVFIVFNLEHDLESCPPLEYLPSTSEPPIQYQSPYTVGEMLSESLLSVPITKEDEVDSQRNSFVFIIGTHKDKVSAPKIDAINKQLLQIIQDTPQYLSHMVQRCNSESVVFPVHNFSSLENDKDFQPIRRATQGLIYGQNSFKIKAPTSWLFVGIVLQKCSDSQPIISLKQCKDICTQCGLEFKDIEPCLNFLHSKLGIIKYYSTMNLSNLVFLKPQMIINLISQLMRGAFKKPAALRAVMDDCDIQEAVKATKFVHPQLMLKVMQDLLMSAPHPDSTAQHSLHYLTCMLPVDMNTKANHDPAAVLFSLKGFSLPTGLGRSIITSLLQNQMQTYSPCKVNYDLVFRNSLEFTAGNDNTTFKLTYNKQYLQLGVLSKITANMSTLKVLRCIKKIMATILKLYNYDDSFIPNVSFFCSECSSELTDWHFALLETNGTLQCLTTRKICIIPPSLKHWLKVSNVRPLL